MELFPRNNREYIIVLFFHSHFNQAFCKGYEVCRHLALFRTRIMGCSTSKPTRADFYDKVVKDIPTIFHHDWDLFPEELQEWLEKTVHKTGTKKLVWDVCLPLADAFL